MKIEDLQRLELFSEIDKDKLEKLKIEVVG